KSLRLHDAEDLQTNKAGGREPAVGQAMHETPASRTQGVKDLCRHERSGQRSVATTQSLSDSDDVGLGTPIRNCERCTHPTIATQDLVCNEKDVVLVANLADATVVIRVRNESGCGRPHNGLSEER